MSSIGHQDIQQGRFDHNSGKAVTFEGFVEEQKKQHDFYMNSHFEAESQNQARLERLNELELYAKRCE